MATHKFEPTHFHVAIGSHEPVLRINPGDTVQTWCVDAGGGDPRGERITPGGNPQTGPFYVEGAQPGDTLVVHFDKLWPNRNQGYTAPIVAPWVVDPQFVQFELPKPVLLEGGRRELDTWAIDLEKGTGSATARSARRRATGSCSCSTRRSGWRPGKTRSVTTSSAP